MFVEVTVQTIVKTDKIKKIYLWINSSRMRRLVNRFRILLFLLKLCKRLIVSTSN